MESDFVSALIGAASSIFIGGAVFIGQQRYARSSAAMNIIAEFNTLDWLALRNRVQEDVTLNPELSAMAPVVAGITEEARAERNRLWALIAFYARLSVMFDGKFVARKPVFLAFGEVFAWWYEFAFRYMTELENTSELQHIRQLHRSFKQQANRYNKQQSYRAWRERGRNARAALNRQCEPID